ncbi:hypothetical protein BG842_21580 [Haladaptatus sp. W1]|uniref:hypothetical protein n=1 Tax=Haladaptatus sp. W1 TaxID=1897478 RepID=UPI000849C69E|nr:hypothetical protein [Haladaptatus sp. W1]ODR81704.1 hypothetical protein BG842_21580 [Haladaptatus sp. W1]
MEGEPELLSVDEFEDELGKLLETSARNGIDFDRSWTFRLPNDELPDIMVEITSLQKPTSDSEER